MQTTPWTYAKPGRVWQTLEADLASYEAQAPGLLTGMQAELKPEPLTGGTWWRWVIPEEGRTRLHGRAEVAR